MLRLVLASALMIFTLCPFFGTAAAEDTYVKGYTRKDGTYVQSHHRSAPDGNPNNNWSTKGNENPYTGKPGTQSPDSPRIRLTLAPTGRKTLRLTRRVPTSSRVANAQ